jgi:low affinity Fe/Cu permease
MQETQGDKLREQEAKGNLFCVVSDAFRIFARRSSAILGSAWAFAIALIIIAVWAITGPTFHFSDTWQLIINTGTTIVTFLMVFLIQNTQNRDAKATQLKLNEVIRALKNARNELVDLEELSEEDLKKIETQFQRIRRKAENDGHYATGSEPAQARSPQN